MADSIRRQVLANIQTTLRGITLADGYNYNVNHKSVSLDPMLNLFSVAGDEPYYVIEPVAEGTIEYFPADQLVHGFRVNITGKNTCDISDPEGKVDTWEQMIQDVETALAVDITRGGLVVDTRMVAEPEPFVGVGSSKVLVMIPIVMKLHRTYGTP